MSGCQMSLQQVALAVHGALSAKAQGDALINGVSTDSRKIEEQQLFVALKGPNFDAHDYVARVSQIAAAAIVEREIECDLPQIVVAKAHDALGQLAAAWRAALNIPVIGVTGSNGKTTVKEMLAAIFSVSGNTFATKGNLNNDIGVPLSLLSVDKTHATAIIEMGANHANEIAYLTNIARPNIALVNNAGEAHLEGFGSLKGVARAKGEIYQGLVLGGTAIINADDQFAPLWRELCANYTVLTFGLEKTADVKASRDDSGSVSVQTPAGEFEYKPALIGKHNILNAMASTAAAVAANVPLAQIKQGLESMQPVPGRLQPAIGINGALFINDAYNANPLSTRAAIMVLKQYAGPKILVLGDMRELGVDEESLHSEIGLYAKTNGIDKLLGFGPLSENAISAFGSNGRHFDSQEELSQHLKQIVTADSTVLIKGSRSMKMEKVFESCTDKKGGKP